MSKDLDSLIARVAVLRTEARTAEEKAKEARQESFKANEKLQDADSELSNEIKMRIDALDPDEHAG